MKVIKFAPGLTPVLKHQEHDQSSHGNWAEGSQGSTTELADSDIQDILHNSKSIEEMYQKVADRLGKTLKPKVEVIPEGEENLYRGLANVERDAQQLIDGKIPFTPFQTWGQGIYATPDRQDAEGYGQVVRMKLDSTAKIITGEPEPFAVDTSSTPFKSDFIDFPRLLPKILSGEIDNFSISDAYNIYYAAKGYDGYQPHGGEMVLFNGSHLTVNKADIGSAVQKHGEHDQSSHGSWAEGRSSYPEAELDALDKEREQVYAQMRALGKKNNYESYTEQNNDPEYKKLSDKRDKISEEWRALRQKFYDDNFDQKPEDEEFNRLRDKYVVADTPTLKMNRQLREGGGLTQRVKDADKLVQYGVLTNDIGVYRGAILPKAMVDGLKVGTSFVDKGFQSTDESKSSATSYADLRRGSGIEGESVLFRMTVQKGLNAVDVGYGEIVVQRNTVMTVTNKSQSEGFTVIDVEVSAND
jgi:hypothetical protein